MSATTAPTRQCAAGTFDMTGWCRDCRASSHKLCQEPECGCDVGLHPKRRSAEAPDDPLADVRVRARSNGGGDGRPAAVSSRKPGTGKPTAKLTAPVWELVKADPPAPPPKRQKNVELARPMLEQLMAEGDKAWHRLAVFPSSMGASQTCGRMRKAYPREWEWLAVKVPEVGQSALYVRWLGAKPGGQL